MVFSDNAQVAPATSDQPELRNSQKEDETFYKLVDDAIARFSRGVFIGGIGLLTLIFLVEPLQEIWASAQHPRTFWKFVDFVMGITRLLLVMVAVVGACAFSWTLLLASVNSLTLAKSRPTPQEHGWISRKILSLFSSETKVTSLAIPAISLGLAMIVLLIQGVAVARAFLQVVSG